jgi:bidirectional [NiFe] hydrogenase diaphorase subunit
MVVCNADEGDPGAFMDRSVLESDPHRVLEGMAIAAYAVGASEGYIYVRAEYPLAVARLKTAIRDAERQGLLGNNICGSHFNFRVNIRLGAGAFVCGEETALIASIEGKRGMPRPRPPYPAASGLFGLPTLINNVETYANIAPIIRKGGDWFASIGTERSKGTKVFALAGAIQNAGLIEVPMGISLRDIIFEIGGGIPDNKGFKAVQTGGPSGGCIPEAFLDTPVDYETLTKLGSIMGSGGMIVMDETSSMVDVARYFMEFCMTESCGKCVPCRAGTAQMYRLLGRFVAREATLADMALLESLCDMVKHTSLCGLGQSAPNPVTSTLRYFRPEYEAAFATEGGK